MRATERKTISFDAGESQAVRYVLEEKEVALDIVHRQVARHYVPALGRHLVVSPVDEVESMSDAVRVLVRLGLDVVERERLAREYERAAPEMAKILSSPAMAGLLAASDRALAESARQPKTV
jgi:hypothetical protein